MVNDTLTIINNTRIATLDGSYLCDPNFVHLITYILTCFPEIPSIIILGSGISTFIATEHDEMKTLIVEFLIIITFKSFLEVGVGTMTSTPTAKTLFGLNIIFAIFLFTKFLSNFTDTGDI